jgi:hypothetical protein
MQKMNSKERLNKALNFEEADRIPYDLAAEFSEIQGI